MIDYYEEIRAVCGAYMIEHFNKNEGIEINTDLSIAISWRWLIHSDKKVIVLHDSLLPQYKGWAPLVTSLINGDTKIGVSAFIANEEADSGEIIMREATRISYPIKIAEAIHLITPLYYQICYNIIDDYLNKKEIGTLPYSKGDLAYTSYSMWRDEGDYMIDWYQPASDIVNFVNAVGLPYTGAVSYAGDEKVKVLDCESYPDVPIVDRQRHVGKVFCIDNGKYVVVTGDGLLKLNEVIQCKGNFELKTNKLRIRFR